MSTNPFSGLFATFGDLLHALTNAGRHADSATEPSGDVSPLIRDVLASTGKAYDSTWRAFDTNVEDAGEFDARDAAAKADADALSRLFEQRRDDLTEPLRSTLAILVERVETAQLQLMAFAINRKNRGEPDAAQVEAELADRRAFRQECGELIGQLPENMRALLRP